METSLKTALEEGRTSEAQALLGTLLKQTQIQPEVLLRTGILFAQNGLYDDAALIFRRCIQEHPEIFEAHYDLALAEFAGHRYPEAFRDLRVARAQNRREQLALIYLRGKIEDALGQPGEAKRDLGAAFSADPSEENYALDLGLFDLDHNAFPQAMKVFAQARKFHPHSVITGLGLALAQYFSGRTPDCITTCRELLSERPDFAPLRTLLAFAFYMEGNLREADEAARRGISLSVPHPYLDYIDVAALLKMQSKDYGLMLSEISTAERQIPHCSLCYLAQSKIDEAAGEREAAIQDLKMAIQFDPAFSDAWYRLAALYEQTGQRGNAAQARMHFTALKAEKSQRETDMLRSAFMHSLAGSAE